MRLALLVLLSVSACASEGSGLSPSSPDASPIGTGGAVPLRGATDQPDATGAPDVIPVGQDAGVDTFVGATDALPDAFIVLSNDYCPTCPPLIPYVGDGSVQTFRFPKEIALGDVTACPHRIMQIAIQSLSPVGTYTEKPTITFQGSDLSQNPFPKDCSSISSFQINQECVFSVLFSPAALGTKSEYLSVTTGGYTARVHFTANVIDCPLIRPDTRQCVSCGDPPIYSTW